MTLAEMFNATYPELLIRARRITQRQSITYAPELINSTYLDIHQDYTYPSDKQEFIMWFSRAMKLRYIGARSNFNKGISGSGNCELQDCPDEDSTSFEIHVEDTNQATKELIEASSSMKKERLLKYIQVLEFKRTLPLDEQMIFDIHYQHGLSSRAISKRLSEETGFDFHYQRVNKMINSVKLKLQAHQWKQ